MALKDLSGQRFGDLLVLSRAPNLGRRTMWLCRCDCGTEKPVQAEVLNRGDAHGCGCRRKYSHLIHGGSRRREYYVWTSAKQRCYSATNARYKTYGARGITMCAEWRDDFAAFLRDMGPCPLGMTLDRIDNDGPYSPDNCRWASRLDQANNKTSNTLTSLGTDIVTVAEAARRLGLKYSTVQMRVYRHGVATK